VSGAKKEVQGQGAFAQGVKVGGEKGHREAEANPASLDIGYGSSEDGASRRRVKAPAAVTTKVDEERRYVCRLPCQSSCCSLCPVQYYVLLFLAYATGRLGKPPLTRSVESWNAPVLGVHIESHSAECGVPWVPVGLAGTSCGSWSWRCWSSRRPWRRRGEGL